MRSLLNKLERIHTLYFATFLFFLTCITYTNTLGNQLFFDDEDFIYNNTFVQQFSLKDFFTSNSIAGAGKVSNYYRPLLLTTYATEYHLAGNNGTLYHLTSFLLHAAAGITLFLVLKKLFSSPLIPLFAATLFVIHPVQAEAVAYAAGRSDPMAVFLMMLSILFFLRGSTQDRIVAVCLFVAALLTRETAIVTPGLLFAIFFFQTKSLVTAIKKIKSLWPFFTVAAMYILLRLTALNFQNTLNFFPSETAYSTHLSYRLLTFLSIVPQYLSLLFFPKTLNIEREIPTITSLTYLPSLLIGVILIVLLIVSFHWRKKYPVFLFSFLWVLVTILPTMGIIPINGVMYEHFLYLPLVGVFMPIGFFVVKILKKAHPVLSLLCCGIVIAFLCGLLLRTLNRNADWRDPITFYTKTIAVNPNSARIHNNLAMSYAAAGQHKDAIREYSTAIQLSDSYAETHYNLGNSYVAINDLGRAEQEYKKAIAINPLFLRGYTNLVSLYTYEKKEQEKKEVIQKVAILAEKNPSLQSFVRYLQSI